MQTLETLILFREDLTDDSKKIALPELYNNLGIQHFKLKPSIMYKQVLVVFIDDDGQTLILKNRYGFTGQISKK